MPGKTLYCLGEAWLELNSTAPLASAETFSPRMGGSAASLALAYAAQGGRASLLTQLGEDAFGHRIADALSAAGVDISRVRFTSRAPTPLLFDGGGEQLGCRTRSSELLYAPEQLGADWAADAEILAFSSACLVDSPCRYTHLAALDTARTAGVPVCFVPSLRPALWPGEKTLRDTMLQFLPFADISQRCSRQIQRSRSISRYRKSVMDHASFLSPTTLNTSVHRIIISPGILHLSGRIGHRFQNELFETGISLITLYS